MQKVRESAARTSRFDDGVLAEHVNGALSFVEVDLQEAQRLLPAVQSGELPSLEALQALASSFGRDEIMLAALEHETLRLIPVAAQSKNSEWKRALIELHGELVESRVAVNRLHDAFFRLELILPAVQSPSR